MNDNKKSTEELIEEEMKNTVDDIDEVAKKIGTRFINLLSNGLGGLISKYWDDGISIIKGSIGKGE